MGIANSQTSYIDCLGITFLNNPIDAKQVLILYEIYDTLTNPVTITYNMISLPDDYTMSYISSTSTNFNVNVQQLIFNTDYTTVSKFYLKTAASGLGGLFYYGGSVIF